MEDLKAKIRNLEMELSVVRKRLADVARTLYRWDGWHSLPWGIAQTLHTTIRDELAEEERKREEPPPPVAKLEPTAKRHPPTPWD